MYSAIQNASLDSLSYTLTNPISQYVNPVLEQDDVLVWPGAHRCASRFTINGQDVLSRNEKRAPDGLARKEKKAGGK